MIICIIFPFGLGGAIKTAVFVEQTLASPGSAKYIHINVINYWQNIEEGHTNSYFASQMDEWEWNMWFLLQIGVGGFGLYAYTVQCPDSPPFNRASCSLTQWYMAIIWTKTQKKGRITSILKLHTPHFCKNNGKLPYLQLGKAQNYMKF